KCVSAKVVAIKQVARYNPRKTLARSLADALFVGFAPPAQPRIVVSATVEIGEEGGRVAVRVVREILAPWLLHSEGTLKPEYATPPKAPGNPHA
ncbi:penicillin-binding protein 2, partial [Pseudomonas syringae]